MRERRTGKEKIKCKICGKEFLVYKCCLPRRKYCSIKCRDEAHRQRMLGKNMGGHIFKNCPICNKKFRVYKSSIKYLNRECCSRKCKGILHRKKMLGHPSGMKGKKHPSKTIAEYKRIRNTKEWRDKIFTPGRNKKISITKKLKYGSKRKDKRYLKNLIRKSADYRQWRKAVFERDNYTCQICKKRNKKGISVYLEADHILSFELYPQLRFVISNGRTLCKECHRKTHNFGVKIWQKKNV